VKWFLENVDMCPYDDVMPTKKAVILQWLIDFSNLEAEDLQSKTPRPTRLSYSNGSSASQP